MGHAWICCPGWILLASQFWIYNPPHPQFVFPRPPKNDILILHGCGDAHPLLKNISDSPPPFLAVFVGNSAHRSRLSRTTSNPALKNGKAKIAIFFRRNFVTILSRRSRLLRATSGPTRLIRPRPIDCDQGSEQPAMISRFLANLFFEHRRKLFLSEIGSSILWRSKLQKKPIAGFSWPESHFLRDKWCLKN